MVRSKPSIQSVNSGPKEPALWCKITQKPRTVCCRQEGNKGRRRKTPLSARWGFSGGCGAVPELFSLLQESSTAGEAQLAGASGQGRWHRRWPWAFVGRQETGTDWTHMASMVWAQSAALLWGPWISFRWHHPQWLIIFRVCGNMFWGLPYVNYACCKIWLQEACEIKAKLQVGKTFPLD